MKLARRVSGIAESVTLALTSKAKKMAKEGVDVVNFAGGEPEGRGSIESKAFGQDGPSYSLTIL